MFQFFSALVFNAHLLKCLLFLWFWWQQFPGVFCNSMKIISPDTCQSDNCFSFMCQLHGAMLLCWSFCSSCLGLGISAAKNWSDGLICILWAKERFSTSARTLPCRYREGGEPQCFVAMWFWLICGFNHFLLAEDYPALYQELTHGSGVFPQCVERANICVCLRKLVS